MAGEKPPRPRVAPVRTSMVDGGWEEGTDTDVEQPIPPPAHPEPVGPLPPPPRPPSQPPIQPKPPRAEASSVTEVDDLLEEIDDDADATLATVRREDLEHVLGAPPPDAVARFNAPAVQVPAPAPLPEPAVPPPPSAAPAEPAVLPLAQALADAPVGTEPAAALTPTHGQVDVRYATGAAGGVPGQKQRAQVGWLQVGLMLAGASLFCLALGFVLGRAGHKAPIQSSPAASVSAAPSPSSSAAVEAPAPPPVPTSLTGKAAAGDPAAIKQLEARSGLDINAVLALSQGQVMHKRRELDKLGDKLEDKPSLASDGAVRHQLITAVRDPETARSALRIMATLKSSDGPDLLYETWTGTPRRTEATRLAELLVFDKSVRARAAPPLAVALDLRKVEGCDAAKKLLPAAKDHGDRRSLTLLARMQRHFGCGPRKKQDCYECLRKGDDLVDAIKAVRKRPGPRF